MTKFFLFLAALASSAAVITPAVAQEVETRTVAVADLDLATDAGRIALDRRLVHAVIEVCGDASNVDLAGKNDVRDCRTRTLAAARSATEQRLAARSSDAIRIAAR
jgi:UrcA family protein